MFETYFYTPKDKATTIASLIESAFSMLTIFYEVQRRLRQHNPARGQINGIEK